MAYSLPHPLLIDGLNHIPPPPAKNFDAVFGGVLPKGKDMPSSWGVTRLYDFNPTADPSARRILLIHGGGTPAIGMAALALKLTEDGNHVVSYDLWGHGNSSTPLEAHTPALLHAQILEVLVYLKWSTANFLGFSMGGAVLATFLAIHPHVAESAVFLAGAGLWRKSNSFFERFKVDGGWGREWIGRRTILDIVEGTNPPLRDGWQERLKNGQVDTEPVQKWERENHKGHVASVVSMFRYGTIFDHHASYKKIAEGDLQTLVILGGSDPVIEPGSTRKELGELGWRGEIKVIDGATHEIVRSHVQEVANLLGEFWRKL